MRLYFLFFLLFASWPLSAQKLAQKQFQLMGCWFEVKVFAQEEEEAQAALAAGIAEMQRIEALISSWQPNSATSQINAQAGQQAVRVPTELLALIQRAKKISALSDGAFDISFAPKNSPWQFEGQTLEKWPKIPPKASSANWQNIQVDELAQTVYLPDSLMQIGFGGLGKGYAADRAKALMQKMPGVTAGLVNASGDLNCWGQPPGKAGWTIQILSPDKQAPPLGYLQLNGQALVSSGDYEKFFYYQGRRYAHIINPKTGLPTQGIQSASVLCPSAELADALATALFVLGPDKGLALIDQLEQIEAFIWLSDNSYRCSKNIEIKRDEK